MNEIIKNRLELGLFPSPLHKLNNLSKQYPDNNIYIKRDDLTDMATGGNKVRKLEYLLYDAVENGCSSILTSGAQQSNHCRQTAAACSRLGLACHLLMSGNEPDKYTGNLLLSKLLGAQIHFTGKGKKESDLDSFKKDLEERHPKNKHYLIPLGGSSLLGAVGFINAVNELKKTN